MNLFENKPPSYGIVVSGHCPVEPGPVCWRGVDLDPEMEGVVMFESKVYEGGTNNIGEFLAITHGIALAKKLGLPADYPIYSASQTGRVWVGKGWATIETCKSKELKDIVTRANSFLKDNSLEYQRVFAWEKNLWGQSPATYQLTR